MLNLNKVPMLRNAKLESIAYDYEDEPLLFVCKDNNGELYLCECAECRFPRTWLVGITTAGVLYNLINKEITIRDALTFKECILIRENVDRKYVISQDFDERFLPTKNSKLVFSLDEFSDFVQKEYYKSIFFEIYNICEYDIKTSYEKEIKRIRKRKQRQVLANTRKIEYQPQKVMQERNLCYV